MTLPVWGEEIKKGRQRLGETQEQFAKRWGVSRAMVSLWESGSCKPPARVVWWLSTERGDVIDKLRQLVEIQGLNGTWNYDRYMRGMYNGMELMLAVIEDREPQYRSAPEQYLADVTPDSSQVEGIEARALPGVTPAPIVDPQNLQTDNT